MSNFAADYGGFTTVPEYVKIYPKFGTLLIAGFMTDLSIPIIFVSTVATVPHLVKALDISARSDTMSKDSSWKC